MILLCAWSIKMRPNMIFCLSFIMHTAYIPDYMTMWTPNCALATANELWTLCLSATGALGPHLKRVFYVRFEKRNFCDWEFKYIIFATAILAQFLDKYKSVLFSEGNRRPSDANFATCYYHNLYAHETHALYGNFHFLELTRQGAVLFVFGRTKFERTTYFAI